MLWNNKRLFLPIIMIISLGASVMSLGLQKQFGHLPMLILLGPLLAALGATLLALALRKPGKP